MALAFGRQAAIFWRAAATRMLSVQLRDEQVRTRIVGVDRQDSNLESAMPLRGVLRRSADTERVSHASLAKDSNSEHHAIVNAHALCGYEQGAMDILLCAVRLDHQPFHWIVSRVAAHVMVISVRSTEPDFDESTGTLLGESPRNYAYGAVPPSHTLGA